MTGTFRSGGHLAVVLEGVGRLRSSSNIAQEPARLALSADANDRLVDLVIDHIDDLAKRGPDLAAAVERALVAGLVRVEHWAPDDGPGYLRVVAAFATGPIELLRIDDPADYGIEGDQQ